MNRRTKRLVMALGIVVILLLLTPLLIQSLQSLFHTSFSVKRFWIDRDTLTQGQSAILRINAQHTDGAAHFIALYFTPTPTGLSVSNLTGTLLQTNGTSYVLDFYLRANQTTLADSFYVSASLPAGVSSQKFVIILSVSLDGKPLPKTWDDVSILAKI